jgi:hypothetical protein
MYRWLLIAHSAWRWVVVVAGLLALLRAAATLSTGKDWNPKGARSLRLFSISLDIQVLMGAALYLTVSPLTTVVPSTAGERLPTDSQAYYFSVIHPLIMLAAFIAVHIAAVLVRRGRSEMAYARRAMIFCGVTWLLVLAGIPWWRPWMRI